MILKSIFKPILATILLSVSSHSFSMEGDRTPKVQEGLEGVSFARGYQVIEQHGTAIIGMSPGNSHFKKEVILHLLKVASSLFCKIYIVIPDVPAIHNFKALGYSQAEAEKKAKQKTQRIKRTLRQAIASFAQTHDISKIHILDWKTEIDISPEYQEKLKYMNELIKTNSELQYDIHASSEQIIASLAKKENKELPQGYLNEAAQYILKEMAFLAASTSICKSETITDVYHRPWPVWNKFASGYYDGNISEVGNVVIV